MLHVIWDLVSGSMNECENKTIDYYNTHAKEFQQSVQDANMTEMCDRFLEHLAVSSSILDLGCGTGRDSIYFISRGHIVTPVDASAEMCKIAEENTGVRVRQLRFENLDYFEAFDGIWACASLLHVDRENIPIVLKKINRSLKKNGVLYMSYKYGSRSEERNGRFFTDMNEEDIPFLCSKETRLEIMEYSITEDVRPDRKGDRWLNLFVKKEKCCE